MLRERLSSAALIHIRYLAEVNLDEVVALFAKKHPIEMGLGTLLKEQWYNSIIEVHRQLNGWTYLLPICLSV